MELSKEKWEKLVCVMFTGVELSGGNEGLLVSGEIRKILGKSVTANLSPYLYLPNMAALYQENRQGDIVDVPVFETGDGELSSDGLPPCIDCPAMQATSMIGMSYSPCQTCAEKMVEGMEGNLPTIHLAWVHNDDIKGIKYLIKNGFNVKVWETIRICAYLAQKAPKEDDSKLRKELLEAFRKLIVPLSKRDSMTQEHIEEAWKAIKTARLEEPKAQAAATQEGATEGTEKDTSESKTAEGAKKKTCRRKTAKGAQKGTGQKDLVQTMEGLNMEDHHE